MTRMSGLSCPNFCPGHFSEHANWGASSTRRPGLCLSPAPERDSKTVELLSRGSPRQWHWFQRKDTAVHSVLAFFSAVLVLWALQDVWSKCWSPMQSAEGTWLGKCHRIVVQEGFQSYWHPSKSIKIAAKYHWRLNPSKVLQEFLESSWHVCDFLGSRLTQTSGTIISGEVFVSNGGDSQGLDPIGQELPLVNMKLARWSSNAQITGAIAIDCIDRSPWSPIPDDCGFMRFYCFQHTSIKATARWQAILLVLTFSLCSGSEMKTLRSVDAGTSHFQLLRLDVGWHKPLEDPCCLRGESQWWEPHWYWHSIAESIVSDTSPSGAAVWDGSKRETFWQLVTVTRIHHFISTD